MTAGVPIQDSVWVSLVAGRLRWWLDGCEPADVVAACMQLLVRLVMLMHVVLVVSVRGRHVSTCAATPQRCLALGAAPVRAADVAVLVIMRCMRGREVVVGVGCGTCVGGVCLPWL